MLSPATPIFILLTILTCYKLNVQQLNIAYGEAEVPNYTIDVFCGELCINSSSGACLRQLTSYAITCAAYEYGLWLNNNKLRPYLTLTANYHNYCQTNSDGFRRTIDLMREARDLCSLHSNNWTLVEDGFDVLRTDLISVFGTFTSDVAQIVALEFGNLCIPVLCASSTATVLDELGYFIRSIPSDRFQARMLADLMLNQSLQLAVVLYETSTYGEGLFELLMREMDDPRCAGICIETVIPVSPLEDYGVKVAIQSLRSAQSRLVITLTSANTAKIITDAIAEDDFAWFREYQLISSDALVRLGHNINPDVVAGTLVTYPDVESPPSNFSEIVKNTDLKDAKTNYPYLHKLIEIIKYENNCSTEQFGQNCNGTEKVKFFGEDLVILSKIAINSMNRLSEGLLAMFRNNLRNQTDEYITKNLNGALLRHYIDNCSIVNPNYMSSDGDSNKSTLCYVPSYRILQYQINNTSKQLMLVEVGNWSMDDGIWLNGSSLMAGSIDKTFSVANTTQQTCLECPAHQYKTPQGNQCCVVCKNCTPFQILTNNGCSNCPHGQIHNSSWSGCTNLGAVMYSVRLTDSSTIGLVFFGIVGLIATALCLIVITNARATPAVKVAGYPSVALSCIVAIVECLVAIVSVFEIKTGITLCTASWIITGGFCVLNSIALKRKLRVYESVICFGHTRNFFTITSDRVFRFASAVICLVEVLVFVILVAIKPPKPVLIAQMSSGKYIQTCSWYGHFEVMIILGLPSILLILTGLNAMQFINSPTRMMALEARCAVSYVILQITGNLIFIPEISIDGGQAEEAMETSQVYLGFTLFAGVAKLVAIILPLVILITLKPENNVKSWVHACKMPKLSNQTTDGGPPVHIWFEWVNEDSRTVDSFDDTSNAQPCVGSSSKNISSLLYKRALTEML